MVGTVAEVQGAKAILAQAQAELRQSNIPLMKPWSRDHGGVPSAVVLADQLQVDFFSSNNDLSQYIVTDRTPTRHNFG